MPRVHRVKKSRKEQGKCSFVGCDIVIDVGMPYLWWKSRYGPKRVRCIRHYPRPSDLTTSDKLAELYGAREDVEDAISKSDLTLDGLADALEAAAESSRNVGEMYNESADNQEEYFPGSYVVDEIREKADACESWADQLEETANDIRERLDELSLEDACDLAGNVLCELEL